MEPVCELKNKREGINSASPYVAVMDGDLQHMEQLLPHMLDVLRREPVDLVVGSRYMAGGEIGEGLRASLTAGL
jgi:dolichol-phosphate mannosyltransferase